MAYGDPTSSNSQHIQVTLCQFCGRDLPSDNGTGLQVNYQKQVDPPATPYSQILPDSRYDEDAEEERRRKGKSHKQTKPVPARICIPLPVVAGKCTPKPSDKEESNSTAAQKTDRTEKSEESQAKEKTGGSKAENSSPLKAACLPGGSCPPPVKMMLCLPCPPPEATTSSGAGSSSTPCPRAKPTDYTYRCESRELRGGNLYQCCQCSKRNGLQHDCPRTPCQGRPACLTKPWPDCWPSGGCHGIDYSREKGVKRFDPCRAQRFDKKECKPPGAGGGGSGSGSGSSKSDCGGNMMVVVCPSPSPQN